jgi:membrane-associated HD superfamily phosphohydrolase
MGNFSLNNFLPNKKGYFSYTGTLPYGTCNGSYSYVVYNIDDALNINLEILEKLNKIISKTTPSIKDNNFFYNKNGANSKGQDDNIYIDCQPVNEEGQLLVQEGTSVQTTQSAKSSGPGIEAVDDGYQMLEGLLIGAILVYGLVFVFKRMRRSSLDAK